MPAEPEWGRHSRQSRCGANSASSGTPCSPGCHYTCIPFLCFKCKKPMPTVPPMPGNTIWVLLQGYILCGVHVMRISDEIFIIWSLWKQSSLMCRQWQNEIIIIKCVHWLHNDIQFHNNTMRSLRTLNKITNGYKNNKFPRWFINFSILYCTLGHSRYGHAMGLSVRRPGVCLPHTSLCHPSRHIPPCYCEGTIPFLMVTS